MNARKKSQLQEKSVAKEFNAKTVIASGSLWFADSDVRSDKFLIECKTTDKDYYSLTAKVWEKIENEATLDHLRTPLMAIDIESGNQRLIVFNPKDFDTPAKVPYDCTAEKGVRASYRVSNVELEESEKMFGDRIWGKLFNICGKKNHLLMFMRIEDFKEVYKGEL